MGTFTDAAKNTMLDALTGVYASLHTADPSTSGANEVSGGSPAYARKAVTFNAASAGSRALNANVVFDVPASTTVAYVGYFSASSGGTFLGSHNVTDEVFASQGTYTLLAASTSLSLT